MNITTRKFPRTLNEAFPFGAEYGNAIEFMPRDTWLRRIVRFFIFEGARACKPN